MIISAAFIVMAKRLQYLLVGWMWYVITILPVIGIIQNGDYAMADRYTYLPSVGITVMLVWGITSMVRSEEIRRKLILLSTISI